MKQSMISAVALACTALSGCGIEAVDEADEADTGEVESALFGCDAIPSSSAPSVNRNLRQNLNRVTPSPGGDRVIKGDMERVSSYGTTSCGEAVVSVTPPVKERDTGELTFLYVNARSIPSAADCASTTVHASLYSYQSGFFSAVRVSDKSVTGRLTAGFCSLPWISLGHPTTALRGETSHFVVASVKTGNTKKTVDIVTTPNTLAPPDIALCSALGVCVTPP